MEIYTLTNQNGLMAKVMTYGAIVTELLRAGPRAASSANVVLGFDNLEPATWQAHPYFGALVGRYGNRIAKGPVHAGRQGLHAGRQQRTRTTCTAA